MGNKISNNKINLKNNELQNYCKICKKSNLTIHNIICKICNICDKGELNCLKHCYDCGKCHDFHLKYYCKFCKQCFEYTHNILCNICDQCDYNVNKKDIMHCNECGICFNKNSNICKKCTYYTNCFIYYKYCDKINQYKQINCYYNKYIHHNCGKACKRIYNKHKANCN